MTATLSQPCILGADGPLGRSLSYRCIDATNLRAALTQLRDTFEPSWGVVGLGQPLTAALGKTVAGLRAFPALAGLGPSAPSTQEALWISLRDTDRGALFDHTRALDACLGPALLRVDTLDTFSYRVDHDLTGYEDGTENPKGDAASAAALCADGSGASFVAVQRWVHDLRTFEAMPRRGRDHVIGRSFDTNVELADAPASAHVKRAAQESFEPPAFMLRRSMPWAAAETQGLEFVAYVAELDRFERVLQRMLGLEDGVLDALFSFSRPETGGYYFCPPCQGSRLDLRAVGV
jgi:porphyrinogen peroxidase